MRDTTDGRGTVTAGEVALGDQEAQDVRRVPHAPPGRDSGGTDKDVRFLLRTNRYELLCPVFITTVPIFFRCVGLRRTNVRSLALII